MPGGQSQQVKPPGSPGTGRQINSQACSLPGPCKFHPDKRRLLSAQFRGGNLPEVQVLWEGSQPGHSQPRRPGVRPHRAIQPYLAPSPPLQTRMWMPTMRGATAQPTLSGAFWRPFHESARTISPTPLEPSLVQRMTSNVSPEVMPGLSPISQAGTPRLPPQATVPGSNQGVRQPMPGTSQGAPQNSPDSLSVPNMRETTSTVTSTSSESGSTGPAATEALVTSSSRGTSPSTRSCPTRSLLSSILQNPVRSMSTTTDPGSLELISTETVLPSTTTITELEPPEALQWPLSPSLIPASPSFMSPARTTPMMSWLAKTTLLSPMSPTVPTPQFFPITREDHWLSVGSPASIRKTSPVTLGTKPLKIAQWVLDLSTEQDRVSREAVSPVRAEKEHTEDEWGHIDSTSHLLEQENTETESNSAKQQDLPTQTSTNQSQVGSAPVNTEERLGDDEVVTIGPVAESPKATIVSTDETARVESPKEIIVGSNETTREELPTEGPEIHMSNKSQLEFNLEEIPKTTSKVTMDVNVNMLDTSLPNNSERIGEYVEQGDFKVEKHSEAQVEPTVTKAIETPLTEVIQVKEDEVEMKLEIEDNHEKAQENELNRSWMQEAINLPGVFEIGLIRSYTNDDSDDTLPWSPRIETLSVPESGAASGNDSEETLPWIPRVKTIEKIPRVSQERCPTSFIVWMRDHKTSLKMKMFQQSAFLSKKLL